MKYILLLLLFPAFLPAILQAQNRYDVVIDEIMADPTPPVGLPLNEWIELRNTTSSAINLENWRIGEASGLSGPLPNFILQPDSLVIICTGSAVAAMSAFGATIVVASFPSLDNDGDFLFLRSPDGRTIHAVNYSSAWYQNELKKEGGWTLEMIDTKSPCAGGSNWRASSHLSGGTPGKKNSIDAVNNDGASPRLKRAYTTDSTTIILVFDEPLDSLSGATLSNHILDGGLTLVSAITLPPLFNMVQVKTSTSLLPNIVYQITSLNVKDCRNNLIGTANKVKVGLPTDAVAGEWVINEILFNPRSNAYDYVEFFNNSNKIFDAAKLYFANRNTAGMISSIKALNLLPYYIFPGEYLVITQDAENLAIHYLVHDSINISILTSLPSFPDDEGIVVALNFPGNVVDEVHYKDDWHFRLIDNAEGVSLERIAAQGTSQDAGNWHSAASTAGYGTPGYKNSQAGAPGGTNSTFEVSPKIFSPDNDGRDDIATIRYVVNEPGKLANITIYDRAGRPVRDLVRNGTLGLSGYWNWDGLDNSGKELPVGPYIIFTEIYDPGGRRKSFKTTLVLARPLK